MELRPYQEEARKAVWGEWEQGRDKTLLVLPTKNYRICDYHRRFSQKRQPCSHPRSPWGAPRSGC